VAVPCQDRSRRRRWPKASLYKGLSPGHARSPRATIECACGDKCSGAGKCPHPAGNSPEVNVRREMGKFKPVIFGQIHAAGDSSREYRSGFTFDLPRNDATPLIEAPPVPEVEPASSEERS
jgi:hypothetical protein